MADPNTRSGKRTPVTLKIKFKSETLEQFIERYAVDVSQGGIFIRTKEPLAVGTQMKFEFQLRDASPLIAGEGTVVWTRENDPSRPAIAPGMGVRFDKLAEGSQAVLEKILAEKQKQAPARGGNEATTKPPMFTDTPTKVAPAPLQEALGVGKRRREDSEQTPLPKPMPFHSDAEDFDERAFEEATKVRSLDELAAQTAGEEGEQQPPPADDTKTATKLMPPDELAARRQQGRADSTLADPPLGEPPAESFAAKAMPDRDSAPGLPPSPDGPRPRMLDSGPRSGKMPAQDDVANRTLAGHEPAKAATAARARNDSSGARAVAADASLPAAPKRPSSLPIILGILLVVAGAIAAIYFLFLKEQTSDTTATNTNKGSATVVDKGSAGSAAVENGSAGSATAMTGSAGSAAQGNAATGSATTMAAGSAAHPVDTVIASNVTKGVNVEIEGTDMKGAAPFTAKLEKDQAYKAKVSAPGYVTQELDIKGGQDKVTAKLVAKPKVISVTSTPAGADIAIDGALTGKLSPADITLSASQAARPKIHVTLRRPGYRPLDQIVDASTFTEDDAGLTATINATLTIAPKVVPTNTGTTTTNTGSGSAAPTGTGTGTGSATPTTTGSGTGTGTGSASTGTGTTTPPAGGTTTPPAGGTTTPPAGGTTTPTPPTPPAGGASTGSASSGQVLK